MHLPYCILHAACYIFMYKVKLEKFEGPLDLLLQLIEKDDLDISQISLAAVADDFVNYANGKTDIPLNELADFLLISSKLLYIKSKSLLPYLTWGDEEDDAAGLEEQLKLYKSFLDASKKLEAMIKNKNFLYGRERVSVIKGFYPPLLRRGSAGQAENFFLDTLKEIYMEILGALEPLVSVERKIHERIVSIKQKIEDLRTRIAEKARLGFQEFVKAAKNKTEVIVSFLALLELIKQKVVDVAQGELFSEIEISKK